MPAIDQYGQIRSRTVLKRRDFLIFTLILSTLIAGFGYAIRREHERNSAINNLIPAKYFPIVSLGFDTQILHGLAAPKKSLLFAASKLQWKACTL